VPDEAPKDKAPSDAEGEISTAAAPPAAGRTHQGAGRGLEPRTDESESEGEEDDEDDGPEDLASPEAIARRVAVLEEDDEAERLARDEEAKLAARQKAQRSGRKKGGLEAAASKRLAKIGAKSPVKRSLPTTPDADPLIDRATQLGEWAKKNQGAMTALVGAAILAALGTGIYAYLDRRHEAQASVELAKGVLDEHGRIGDPDKEEDEGRLRDPRPVFRTVEERREAAIRDYRAVESGFKGTGAAILARLAEGALLLDKHDVPGAKSAFEEVRSSLLSKADSEVRGRALESLGFAYELEADEPGDRSALEEASKVFRELENTDVKGFKELGMYHQAGVFEKQGDKPKAIEMLKKLHERLTQPGDNHAFVYLEHVADERLRSLDPTALPAKSEGQLGGPGQNQLSQAQIRRIIEQAQKGQSKTPQQPPVDVSP
jgi:hypothetical protein